MFWLSLSNWHHRRLRDGHLPEADGRSPKHTYVEDALAHAVQRSHQEAQPQDAQVVGVRIVRATADYNTNPS